MNVYVLRNLKVLLFSVSVGVMSTFISGYYQVSHVQPRAHIFKVIFGFPFAWLTWRLGGDYFSPSWFSSIHLSGFVLGTLIYSMIVLLPSIMYFAVRKYVGKKIMINEWVSKKGIKRILVASILIYFLAAYFLWIQEINRPPLYYYPADSFIETAMVLSSITVSLVGLGYLSASIVLAYMKKSRHVQGNKI